MTRQTRAQLKALLHRRQGGLCCYCSKPTLLHPDPWPSGARTPDNFATIEHLRRKVDGGTSDRDNLAIACFECNAERGGMSWVEFKTVKTQQRAA